MADTEKVVFVKDWKRRLIVQVQRAGAQQNLQSDKWTQRRLRSSAQPDHSSFSAWGKSLGLSLPKMRQKSDSGQMTRTCKLIWVFAVLMSFCRFYCAPDCLLFRVTLQHIILVLCCWSDTGIHPDDGISTDTLHLAFDVFTQFLFDVSVDCSSWSIVNILSCRAHNDVFVYWNCQAKQLQKVYRPRWLSRWTVYSRKREVTDSIPGCDIPKSLTMVLAAPRLALRLTA